MTAQRAAAAALLVIAAATSTADAQRTERDYNRDEDRFTWSGTLGDNRTITLRNVNGDIRVEPGTGRTVEVVAVKRWRRGDPRDVRIEARATSAGDVIVCALWNERTQCDESGYHGSQRTRSGSWDDNDVSVEFTIKVPVNARMDASTVNGELSIEGVSGDIRARTTNGDVDAFSNGGRVMAETVNGSIHVRTATGGTESLEYETVNGSITIELQTGANLEVDLGTVNGRLSSDFPMTLDGTINPRRIRATIGNGGQMLRARTINGSIRIEKRS